MSAGDADPLPSIDQLRRRGIGLVAVGGWIALALIALVALALGSGSVSVVLLIGTAVNVGPTVMMLRRRHDASARAVAGMLAAVLPALLVFALRGDDWQMDAHMYFFVALAALIVLCDWKPIAIATALIAVHHLVLELVAPSWAFQGASDLGRVAFHAVAVVMQFGLMAYATFFLHRLLDAQDRAARDSARLARDALAERVRAGEALTLAQDADRERAAERARREQLESDIGRRRRDELLALAAEFEGGVAAVARAMDEAAGRLDSSAGTLDDLAGSAGVEANAAAGSAVETTTGVRDVAGAIRDLAVSVATIADTAQRQAELTGAAERHAAQGTATVSALERHVTEVGDFVDEIRRIAAKTNLLALNATIEASRAGDAGRGFVVVANEVKALATDATQASDRIATLLGDIRGSAGRAAVDIARAGNAARDTSTAANGIARAVEDQRGVCDSIEASAARAADGVDRIEREVGRVAASVVAAAALSTQVRQSASALFAGVRDLRLSTERFVGHLRHDQAA